MAADQIEVSGAIFVPIGMKAHGSNPPVSQRGSLRATPGWRYFCGRSRRLVKLAGDGECNAGEQRHGNERAGRHDPNLVFGLIVHRALPSGNIQTAVTGESSFLLTCVASLRRRFARAFEGSAYKFMSFQLTPLGCGVASPSDRESGLPRQQSQRGSLPSAPVEVGRFHA